MGNSSDSKNLGRCLKSKGGCRTCRIRKVKCDEQKPACKRCFSTGRKCDGYAPVKIWLFEPGVAKKKPEFEPWASTFIHQFGESREWRSFQFYTEKTVPCLSSYFGKSFWPSLPSQLSFTCPATKQALIALSSLHEAVFNAAELNGDVCHPVASYSQAINALTKSNGSTSLESVLTICTMFVCREFMNGQSRTAMLHMRAGLKMIQEWQASGKRVHKPTSIDEDRLRRTFDSFSAKAALYDLSPATTTSSPPNFLDDPFTYELPLIPEIMPSLNDARWTSDGIFLWVMSVLTSRNTLVHSIYVPAVRNMVNKWLDSFDKGRIECGLKSAQAVKLARLLRIQHRVASIIVDTFPYQTEAIFDHFIEDFRSIVEMISPLVLQEVASTGLVQSPHEAHFNLHSGYIAPLFFTATRCRDPVVRRSALRLIRMVNRFEGGWNSCIAARIADHVISREEHSLIDVEDASDVPETSRVRLYSAVLPAAGTNEVVLQYRKPSYEDSVGAIEQETLAWNACDWSSPIVWPLKVLQVSGYSGLLTPVPGKCRCVTKNRHAITSPDEERPKLPVSGRTENAATRSGNKMGRRQLVTHRMDLSSVIDE